MPFVKRRGLYVWDLEMATKAITLAKQKTAYVELALSDPAAAMAYFTKLVAAKVAATTARLAAAKVSGNATGTHRARSTSRVTSLPSAWTKPPPSCTAACTSASIA